MVIYDSFMPWVLDVARKSGLEGAPFFTQSCMVNSIYYHAYKGSLKTPVDGSFVPLPSIKELLRACDLPGLVSSSKPYPSFERVAKSEFLNLEEADCLLINTVNKLDIEVRL